MVPEHPHQAARLRRGGGAGGFLAGGIACPTGLALLLSLAPAFAAVKIDYPADGSVFPPEITAPLLLWRDTDKNVTEWPIEITFEGRRAPIRLTSRGPRLRVGPIDPDCVAPTNEPPRVKPAHTWQPDTATWAAIKRYPTATISIGGARVTIHTSPDPVGAPVFYRDVPLMPTETKKGHIEPLALQALPLVAWRIRNIAEPASRVVMEDMPVCANCHSFSRDGTTMGMDLDGLQKNKGRYFLAQVKPEIAVRREDVIQWSTEKGRLASNIRVGFMSQVSPDGRNVVTTIDPSNAPTSSPTSNYYVTNFKDYRFLQVFYPTRGVLAWYSRETGVLQPLPGADDPQFVQMGGVWSPDGQYIVFARTRAKEPYPPGLPQAQYANDPNENPMQYDLYRVPFNGGKGGAAEPIVGASANGMSNTFPKVSPDGRWIVYVQARNGMLMRPDSKLYIVPAGGGSARRMRCNTPLMNSWHSFSPNGRWLVFSSKSRSPYTQMYLTHIDAEGNDSPAILVENTTAANRAVNIPEFVNVPPDGLRSLGGPAIEYYKLFNSALYCQKQGRLEESAARWKQVLAISPDDRMAHSNLALVLMLTGHRAEAAEHLERAKALARKQPGP